MERKENGMNIKKIFNSYFFVIMSLIITSPFTKLIYFIKDGIIVKGPLAFISFLSGLIVTISLVYFLNTRKVSIKIKKDIYLIVVLLFAFAFCSYIFPNIILSGFSFSCILFVMYDFFNRSDYNLTFGISKSESLEKRLENLNNKKKEYSVYIFECLNIDKIISLSKESTIKTYISNILREIEKTNHNIEIFLLNNKFVFLVPTIEEEQIETIKDFIIEKILSSKINDISKLDYKLTYYSSNIGINNILDVLSYETNENVYKLTKEDFKKIEYNKSLLNVLRDMKNFANPTDPRLVIYYQPILDIKKKRFLTAEALCRLDVKELGGLIFPDKFIPILEKEGFIHKFSLLILEKVCMYIKQLEHEKSELEAQKNNNP